MAGPKQPNGGSTGKEAGKLSLIFCEVCLVVSSLRSAWMLHHNGSIYASKGLVFVGLAASLGALRYAGVPVGPTHELFSRIAATVGIPLIGMQYLHLAGFDLPAPTALHIFVATGLSEAMLRRGLREPVETLLGAAAMGAVGWHSQTPYLGWVASALMVVAGIVVGPSHTRKTLFIWNIDLFHLLLAAAMTVVRLDLTKGMLFGFQ
eukprot:m.301624 g.301624  ORF g.301624 m.301624 type:complete len:206 (+) comp27277_c0_seq4:2636-3253(+)